MEMRSLLFALIMIFWSTQLSSQIPTSELDQLIENTLEAFEVPGISVGILKDGKIVYAKGHGVRSLKGRKLMNEQTLVGVASNSKGFTCFALAMLVDEGKLSWDDKVRKYIPEFQVYDPWVTEEFTIRDLVTHRSGYPLGAGDLMFFPDGNDFSAKDVIAGVKHLEAESSFRSTFRYNNNMFIIAGEVLERISGKTWAEFIEQKIMKPVGMEKSRGSYSRVYDRSNIIEAHTRADGKVLQIAHDWSETANAAGGIMSNVTDMLTWASFLMNGGVTTNGERLISEQQMHELWQLQTPLKVGPDHPYNTHFRGYSLGWFVSDVSGYKEVTHTGGLIGTVTQFTMIPELELGIVVLTNQMVGAAFSSITNAIKDSYLGYGNRNWLAQNKERTDSFYEFTDSLKRSIYQVVENRKSKALSPDKESYIGNYKDQWFGNIIIGHNGIDYTIKCERSPRLFGFLYPYKGSTFVAQWNDRSYDADSFVIFDLDENGMAKGARMKAITPITDFSFDFHDLKLIRQH